MIGDKKVVFISGKITGTNDYLDRFCVAQLRLLHMGYAVINPATVGVYLPKNSPYGLYMDVSLAMLRHADAIYMLSGWKDSGGAKIEYAQAMKQGIEILFEDPDDPMRTAKADDSSHDI